MKTATHDLTVRVKDWLVEKGQEFRESSRAFKVRLGIVVVYGIWVVLSLELFLPHGEHNEIDAEVRIGRTEILGGRYFMVFNQSGDDWKNVKLLFNGGFSLGDAEVPAGQKKAFYFNAFRDNTGRAPEQEIELKSLKIECDAGVFERIFPNERS